MIEYKMFKKITVDTVTEASSLAMADAKDMLRHDSGDVIEISAKHVDELFICVILRIRAKIRTIERWKSFGFIPLNEFGGRK
jgi:nicotinic acid phosphoribosyltransferase